ncbi:MAG TPA: type II toxin-antitoxin system VapC family toxin [Thermomicrobiales bacterium]|nr:type II toxin-antitoxin system VapC family toxin [Thermomicrobiales bacterium]
MSEPVYLDSSVVVAYYVPKPNSGRVQRLYEDVEWPVISELVDLEITSALSIRSRISDLERTQARRIVNLFNEHLDAGLYARLRLQADQYRWARDATARFDLPLKVPDALHLAAAQADGLQLITADRQLARNAEALDIAFELIEA